MNNSKVILGVGLTAFAVLCLFCVTYHAPRLWGELAARGVVRTPLPPAPLAPPTLSAKLEGERIVLSGAFGEARTKARILERARDLFGEGKYEDTIKLQNGAAEPSAEWLAGALKLLPLAARAGAGGGVEVRGHTVTLTGHLFVGADKARLLRDAMTATGAGFTIDDQLVVSDAPRAADESMTGRSLQTELNRLTAGKGVEFDAGGALLPASRALLDAVADALKKMPVPMVEIGGHTEGRGREEANQTLSQVRAEAVRQYLVQKGVGAQRLLVRGYGSSQPADTRAADAAARSPRIEFRVVKVDAGW